MNPFLRNILAVILGWLGGSFVNMSLINFGYKIYPIEGIDPNDFEALAEIMPTLSSEHFIFPFLAHAIGTLVGAFIASWIAINHKMKFALGIGLLFFIGGVAINFLLKGPLWFMALDLIGAYFPMAWIGGYWGMKISNKKNNVL